jgi:putative ABC transport system permease protein
VGRRTREIGIRVALGASRSEILRLLILDNARPAAVGVLLGLAGAEALGGVFSHLLFGVGPGDPATLVSVAALLLGIVVLASWLPARRGTRIEPTVALRCE